MHHKKQKAEDDKQDQLFEVGINTDRHRICRAKLDLYFMLYKLDASVIENTLTATEVPHLCNKTLITNLYDISKIADLDVSTICAEQAKGGVPVTVHSWIRKVRSPNVQSPQIRQLKVLFRYCHELERYLFEPVGQPLCFN